jgi:Sulfotransferase family
MTAHLRSADIVAKAYAEAGVDDVGTTSFREGLGLLVDGANRHPGVTAQGRAALEGLYTSYLVNRLKTEDYVRQHPQVLQAPVERPVFVFGMPRTGTTLVSYLLGADPGLRPLLNWEAVDSVPPPTTATLRTDPRCVEKARQKAAMLAADPSRGRYHWEDADGPTECVFVHGQDFRSAFNEASIPDPAYSRWLVDGDMTPAYEYERRLL